MKKVLSIIGLVFINIFIVCTWMMAMIAMNYAPITINGFFSVIIWLSLVGMLCFVTFINWLWFKFWFNKN